jgi:hypothetical protein
MHDFRHRLSPSLSKRDVAIVKDGWSSAKRSGAPQGAASGHGAAAEREAVRPTARSGTVALVAPRAANDS